MRILGLTRVRTKFSVLAGVVVFEVEVRRYDGVLDADEGED